MKVLFLIPYPVGEAPSQRFRFEQYLDLLEKNGFEVKIRPFLNKKTFQILYKKGNFWNKVIGTLKGIAKRKIIVFTAVRYNYIFIHREASAVGPPVFEWFLAKILRKKIIYDFDDAIWLPDPSPVNKAGSKLKHIGKVPKICRLSYKISVGNNYLADFARRYNNNVIVNPTTIDTINVHNKIKDQRTDELIIGWTGSHSTLKYLTEIIPVIEKLEKEYKFRFLVISDHNPNLPLQSFEFRKWNIDTEIDDLITFNIGLMPLPDDKWANGKCGFKALQYLALGIPAVASPVGVNTEIIRSEVNGFLCQTNEEWYDSLSKLLKNAALREKLGAEGRKTVTSHYSVTSNTQNFLQLFTG